MLSICSFESYFWFFSEKEITSVLSSPQACHTRSTWKNFGREYFLLLVCYWPQTSWASRKRISLKSDLSWSRKRTFDFPPLFHEAKIGWVPVLWEREWNYFSFHLFNFKKVADFFVCSIFTSFSSSWPTAFPSCEKSTDTTWEIHKWGRATLFVETWGLQNNFFFQKYSPLCSWCSYWSHSPIFVDLHIWWWQKTKYRKTTKYWWKSWWLTKYPKRDLKAGRSRIFGSICLSRWSSRGRSEMFTPSWTWRTVVEPSCLGTRISSQWFLGFLSEKSPHRETLLRPIHGHLLVLIALLAALSHPGHRVRHSETSRQLRRCRQWGPFNEDVSSKRAVFNAIWSIYRLMAAPASPIAPAQEEIVHRRAVRRNTVYSVHCTLIHWHKAFFNQTI